jgi:hypothetical protein
MSELFQLKPCEECEGTGIVLIEKHDCDCPDCLGTGFEEPAKQIMNLERELTAITEQRDRIIKSIEPLKYWRDISECDCSNPLPQGGCLRCDLDKILKITNNYPPKNNNHL